MQPDTSPPLSARLFFDVINDVIRPWLRRHGVPPEVLLVPPHLVRYKGLYREYELWPHMYILSHDEKDIKRVKGSLQDWGDGEAQAAYMVKDQALRDLAEALVHLVGISVLLVVVANVIARSIGLHASHI